MIHPALPQDFPPLAAPDRRPNNLSAQASAFIGREIELREIRGPHRARVGASAYPHGSRRVRQDRLALRVGACRLWRSQGRDHADRLLRNVYYTFTKGFATADLTEARASSSLPSQSTG